MKLRTQSAAVVVLGALAAPAHADTWAVPRDGASRPAAQWPDPSPFETLEFTIYRDDGYEPLTVEVGTSPALEDVIDRYAAVPRAGLPEILSARAADPWLATPGQYYWRAYDDDYATPVHALRITPRVLPDPPTPAIPHAPPTRPAPVILPRPLGKLRRWSGRRPR